MHVYFGPACFIFHSIERDNEGLVIFFIFYVPLMASVMYFFPLFFFSSLKRAGVLYTHHADTILYLWSALCFYKDLERYWEDKWHCRAMSKPKAGFTDPSKRSCPTIQIAFEATHCTSNYLCISWKWPEQIFFEMIISITFTSQNSWNQ